MLKRISEILSHFFLLVELLAVSMILANIWVFAVTNGKTYSKISKVPPRECALVLGTSPMMRSGRANPYFTSRMDAAALLFHHGKIKKIIVSGEKSPGYDEPFAMKNYLVYEEGVPEHIIIEDPKGFKTQLSIKRCKEVYKKNDVIIVSQGYHNMRALFFARNLDMNALGFDATDIMRPESYYRNQSREFLARVVAVIYYVFGIEPKAL